MYLQLISFLHTQMTLVGEVQLQKKTRNSLFDLINIVGADALATQKAKASAPVILTIIKRNN